AFQRDGTSGSTISFGQHGDANYAAGTQSDVLDSATYALQVGSDNDVYSVQLISSDAQGAIQQHGDSNYATIGTTMSPNVEVYIWQDGEANQTTIWQFNGYHSSATSEAFGNGNVVSITQSGSELNANTEAFGERNTVMLTQSGSNMQATGEQRGAHNSML